MKNVLTISLFASALLMAGTPVHDQLDARIKGKSFGGTTDDNVAASDGLGAMVLQQHTGLTEINNELITQKVFDRVLKAETDPAKISDIRNSLASGIIGTAADTAILSNVGVTLNPDGTSCNTNPDKTGMTYLSGVCQGGTFNDGVACDDGDTVTSNDVYTGGICKGTSPSLYAFTSHTFTTCGATGRYGPSLSNCTSAYSTDWDNDTSKFNITTAGYQIWTVPSNGTYTIKVAGAMGGGVGGKGAIISGQFSLNQGDIITIAIGQMGANNPNSSSGGGGSFVVKGSTPLIIAGGGGGGVNSGSYPGQNASYSNSNSGNSVSVGYGGNQDSYGAGGAGFYGNGTNAAVNGYGGGLSWTNGLIGGQSNNSAGGGFGGGGGHTNSGSNIGGGGGGYTGGSGAYPTSTGRIAEGGGSYNSGSNQQNVGLNASHGYVTITKL